MELEDFGLAAFLGAVAMGIFLGAVKHFSGTINVSETNLTSNQVFKTNSKFYQCSEKSRHDYLQDQLKLEQKEQSE